MSDSSKKHYLGSHGKIHGPFSSAELEAFHENGKIHDYTFIWNSAEGEWNTIEEPPPSPEGKGRSKRESEWGDLQVICHDFVNLVSGRLEDITETGCQFVCEDSTEYPQLGIKARVMLNLMDTKIEKSLSVEARVAHVERSNQVWSYRLSWKEKPSFKSS